jgi:hypothetical protein
MISKYIKKYLVAGTACCTMAAAFTSCNDFLTIYPTDRIVGTDFWKTKADVDQMVDGAYQSMLSYDIQERAIMWGAYRSDELVKLSDYNDNTLDNISAVMLYPTQKYNAWSAFYKVINNCNIVLNHAPDVIKEDPEFTEDDYQTVRAQMLALRSLCYFYLVRTFHDVPYTTHSYEDDSQIELLEQTSPAVVLQNCLDDLMEAEKYVVKTGSYGRGDWRNWGYMTRDAVDALIADIYLWRASMTHSQSDYQQVIAYADKVIAAKDAYYKQTHTTSLVSSEEDIYHLEKRGAALQEIFSYTFGGNSHESIFELQYNGQNNSNQALENYYYQSGDEKNYQRTGILMASQIFNQVSDNANGDQATKVYFSKNDYRFWNNVYDAGNEEAQELTIRKMIDDMSIIIQPTTTTGATKSNDRAFKEFRQNWIVYRLTDLMLMKAEALVATSTDEDTDKLAQAFNLVQAVNKRSMAETAKDTLKIEDFTSQSDMELLVLAERERELCFEGKRWWDLMRFCYRHMTGVDINSRLADNTSWPLLADASNGDPLKGLMTKMIVRKYGDASQGDAVSYKMVSEPYLYWPIQESEIKVNNLLKQNPVFIQEKSTSKN